MANLIAADDEDLLRWALVQRLRRCARELPAKPLNPERVAATVTAAKEIGSC